MLVYSLSKLFTHFEPSQSFREARWPSGRALDSGARGDGGSILTQVALLCP